MQIQADRKTTQPTGEKEAERNSNRWLDGMPYKELVWNSAFENMRKYANDNRVALQVEVVVLQRIVHSDEPPDILEKLSELADWLDGKMEWLEK